MDDVPLGADWPEWLEESLYYDRAGEPITLQRWAELRQSDPAYCVVAQTAVAEGVRVSTIWLGIDHSFGLGEGLLIFETMVFGGPLDHEQWRYATEAQAWEGHAVMVGRVRAALSTSN